MKAPRWLQRWRGGPPRASAVVLMYHRFTVGGPDPWSLGVQGEQFEDHLRLITERFQTTTLSHLADAVRRKSLATRTVVITMDDGYADNLTVAAPLLAKYDVPATVFVTTSGIDSPASFWWDELAALLLGDHPLPETLPLPVGVQWAGSDVPSDPGWRANETPRAARDKLYFDVWRALYKMSHGVQSAAVTNLRAAIPFAPSCPHRTLTSVEFQTLSTCAHLDIGAHGMTHAPLDGLNTGEMRAEIEGSQHEIEQRLGRPVQSFAFPHGAHDIAACQAVADAAMTVACTTVTDGVRESADPFAIPRLHVLDWDADALDEVIRWWLGPS